MRPSAAALARTTTVGLLSLAPLFIHGALSLGVPAQVAAHSIMGGQLVTLSLVAASALPHTVAYVVLLSTFAISLLPPREPVVTWLARRVSDPLGEAMTTYTRGVTWAWCLFFAAQLLTSLLLLLLAPLAVWSFFVNVLNLPLVALMFAAEYGFRSIHIRDTQGHTIADMIRAVRYLKENLSKPRNSG